MKGSDTSVAGQIREMNILRGFAIFGVVLFHCRIMDPELWCFFHGVYNFVGDWVLSVFMMVAGFFAVKIWDIKTSRQYLDFMKDKVRRLAIPYLVLSFVAIPIKLILNSYSYRPFELNMLLKDVFLYPNHHPISQFWFIYVLFLLFIITPVFNRISLNKATFAALVLTFLPIHTKIFLLSDLVYFLFPFLLGMVLNRNYDKFVALENKPLLAVVGFLILILPGGIGNWVVPPRLFNLGIEMGGIMWALATAYLLRNSRYLGTVFENMGIYNYDIYLLSWFFQTAVRIVFYQMFKWDVNLVASLMALTGVAGPMLISKYFLKKFDLTNRFILGNKSTKIQVPA
ncbi:MAG: acyltransferase [Syntrophomonas sp.]